MYLRAGLSNPESYDQEWGHVAGEPRGAVEGGRVKGDGGEGGAI